MLLAFLGIPPVADALGGTLPTPAGWALAAGAIPAVLLADAAAKLMWRGSAGLPVGR
jgi:hypothetical protein